MTTNVAPQLLDYDIRLDHNVYVTEEWMSVPEAVRMGMKR
jgi:hypothetical protein